MNVDRIRRDFPILSRKINGKLLVYLDSAATSQKPRQVMDAMQKFLTTSNANVHRGIYTLTVEATDALDSAREKVARFVGVKDSAEIIFVRNTTEAINLVAYSWGRINIGEDDEIVTTIAEHHSNFVPWQQLAQENGAVLKVIPIEGNGEIDILAFKKSLTKRTKLVTFFHVSNVLGTVNDVRRLTLVVRRLAPQALVLVDGAQAVPHMPVDIAKIGCDFYAFSAHKMLGPSGIGVLWAKREILEKMPPFLFGGEMISEVKLKKTTWAELPLKFEAGTPNIEGAIGLGAAVDYLKKIGMENVRRHEVELTNYAFERLSGIGGIRLLGPTDVSKRSGVISFQLFSSRSRSNNKPEESILRETPLVRGNREVYGREIPPHDIASILDYDGVQIRSGYNCAEPLADFLGTGPLARASFYIYNNKEDVDKLVSGLKKVQKVFGVGSENSEYSEDRKIRKSDKSENLSL